MMHRHLSKTGESLAVSSDIFARSAPVRQAMDGIRKQVLADLDRGNGVQDVYSSGTFYMGDPHCFDSFVGLYFGILRVRVGEVRQDSVALTWRAEVPWTWPTYQEIFQKYGDYHAQSFPLPNARSVIQGSEHCLRVDDGLGGHLSTIGLAKPFLAYSEWGETLARDGQGPGQQGGAATGSQPIWSETNGTSSAAGSRR
jgi:hypothetical protein